MRKKLIVLLGLAALLAPVGCSTTEPVSWSWPHNKRRLRKITDGLHQVHEDFDRIFFDMEPFPVELDY